MIKFSKNEFAFQKGQTVLFQFLITLCVVFSASLMANEDATESQYCDDPYAVDENKTGEKQDENADGTAYNCGGNPLPKPGAPGLISIPSEDYDGSFTIQWGVAFNSRPPGHYKIEQSKNNDAWALVGQIDFPTRTFQTQNLSNGQYKYRIKACNEQLNSGVLRCGSNRVSHTVIVLHAPPKPALNNRNLTSTPLVATWTQPSGALTHFELQKKASNGQWTNVSTSISASKRSFTLGNWAAGTYTLQLRACNQSACSAWDGGVITYRAKPSAPSVPSLHTVFADVGYVKLTWSTPSHATYFDVKQVGSENKTYSKVTGSSYSVSSLPTGDFRFQVRACNTVTWSCSAYSSLSDIANIQRVSGGVDTPPLPQVPNIPSRDLVSDAVGVIQSDVRVDEGGQANISVPIFTPTGVAGVAPELALGYNSGGGNGLMGVGWSIQGLSSITRCASSRVVDNEQGAVTLTKEDQFCLDGSRLVLVSGVHGESGAEYRTFIESYVKVVAHGSAGTAPDYFDVWRKDGSFSRYGYIDDSQFRANDKGTVLSTPLFWALTYTQDRFNNKINYHYYEDERNGEAHIDYISYSPNVKIQFNFARNRSDTKKGYYLGGKTLMSRLLTSIEVFDNNMEVRQYDFTYGTSRSQLKHLTKITESKDGVALEPMTFEWANPVKGLKPDHSKLKRQLLAGQWAQVDDDPEPEWIHIPHTGGEGTYTNIAIREYDHTTGGYETPACNSDHTDNNVKEASNRETFDIDGDGKDEIIVPTERGIESIAFKKNCRNRVWGSALLAQTGSSTSDSKQWYLGDINGDGLPDLVYHRGGSAFVRFHKGKYVSGRGYYGDEQPVSWNVTSVTAEPSNKYFITLKKEITHSVYGDFNGDGKTDVILKVKKNYRIDESYCEVNPSSCYDDITDIRAVDTDSPTGQNGISPPPSPPPVWVVMASNGDGSFTELASLGNLTTSTTENKHLKLADLNSDGLTDLIYRDTHTSEWRFRLFTGKEFLPSRPTYVHKDHFLIVADHDSDGLLGFYTADGSERLAFHELTRDARANSFRTVTTIPSAQGHQIELFDLNADGELDLLTQVHESTPSGARYYQYISTNINPFQVRDKITRVHTGFGRTTEFTFKALTDPSEPDLYDGVKSWHYNEDTGEVRYRVDTPVYVVKQVDTSMPTFNEANHKHSVSYRYGQLISSSLYGDKGFSYLETHDLQTNVITRTSYESRFPFIGRPLRTTVYYKEPRLEKRISEASNIWAERNMGGYYRADGSLGYRRAAYLKQSKEDEFDFYLPTQNSSASVSTTYTTREINDWGDETEANYYVCQQYISNCLTGGWLSRKRTVNSYKAPDLNRWILGRLERAKVSHYRKDEPTILRVTGFEYATATGILLAEIVAADSTLAREYLKTKYYHDAHGNVIQKVVCNYDTSCDVMPTSDPLSLYHVHRGSTTKYDDDGRYVVWTKNGYGQTTSEVLARNELGLPTKVKNTQGVISEKKYGTFGQEYFSRDATGAWGKTVKRLCSNSGVWCPATGYFRTQQMGAGGTNRYAYHDKLGREVQTLVPNFNGTGYTQISTQYGANGRVYRKSLPVRTGHGESTYWTTHHYDALNRPIRVEHPDGSQDKTHYDKYNVHQQVKAVRYENALGQTKTEYRDDSGKLKKVVDHIGNLLSYKYTAAGDIREVYMNGSIQSRVAYNVRGQKEKVWDWDKGAQNSKYWMYTYNALGETVSQRDAKNQEVFFYRDREGRTISKLDRNKDQVNVSDARWDFDTSTTVRGSTGQLKKEYDLLNSERVVELEYDSLGRNDLAKTTIGGEVFITSTTFDQHGRVFQSFDASGANHGERYLYNSLGYLYQVREARGGSNGKVYRTILDMDAFGNVIKEQLGNDLITTRHYDPKTGLLNYIQTKQNGVLVQSLDYQWDAGGRLEHRQDDIKNLSEVFAYDGLNRVKTINGETLYKYDAQGNIDWKKDVGDYTYGGTCQGVKAGHHAVTSAGNKNYCYDLNGNMVSGDGREISYSTFDKAIKITKGSHTTEFAYSPSRSRYKRLDKSGGNTTTTYYHGSTEYIKSSSGSRYRRQVAGVIINVWATGGSDVSYVLTDHLGSTDMVIPENGATKQFSFDAFGQKRTANWSRLSSSTVQFTPTDLTSRGYTGHEQADEVGLIHMNGRMYDAWLGRFVQADPFVDGAKDSQGYNRYAYVRNNPLNSTDPSGYKRSRSLRNLQNMMDPLGILRSLSRKSSTFQGIYQTAVVTVTAIMTKGCVPCTTAAAAAASTFQLTVLNDGSVRQGLRAGAKTYATAYLSGSLAQGIGAAYKNPTGWNLIKSGGLHGLVGGVATAINGGKFGHGFASAFVSKVAGVTLLSGIDGDTLSDSFARTFIAGMIGGTVSRATGGKFANGAVQSAIQWALNNEGEDAKNLRSLKRAIEGAKRLFKRMSAEDPVIKIQQMSLEEVKVFADLMGKYSYSDSGWRNKTVANLYKYELQKIAYTDEVMERMSAVGEIGAGLTEYAGDKYFTKGGFYILKQTSLRHKYDIDKIQKYYSRFKKIKKAGEIL